VVAVSAACLLTPGAASALELHAEPANALSLPTWAIHVSSVTEWVAAMLLMWRYAEVTGNARWKGMAWGMMPSLGSAMAACTWHFFYNSPGEGVGGWWRGWWWRVDTRGIFLACDACTDTAAAPHHTNHPTTQTWTFWWRCRPSSRSSATARAGWQRTASTQQHARQRRRDGAMRCVEE
jgi:hypothetical protein